MTQLPAPSRDLKTLERNLDELGFCLLEAALEPDQLHAVRQRLTEQATAERALTINYKNPGHLDNQWVNMLINKGEEFEQLVLHPTATDLMTYLLGEEYLLSCCDAQIKHPGSDFMPLHTDQWWMPSPARRQGAHVRPASMKRSRGDALSIESDNDSIAPPAVANVMWMISDFTEDNGATLVVPGSHRSGRQPDQSVPHRVETVAGVGRAGTGLVFDGRLWHAAGRNTTLSARYGITTTFCGPQFRQLENYTRGLRPEVFERASPALLNRLGFNAWSTYGHTGDPDLEVSRNGTDTLGVLSP